LVYWGDTAAIIRQSCTSRYGRAQLLLQHACTESQHHGVSVFQSPIFIQGMSYHTSTTLNCSSRLLHTSLIHANLSRHLLGGNQDHVCRFQGRHLPFTFGKVLCNWGCVQSIAFRQLYGLAEGLQRQTLRRTDMKRYNCSARWHHAWDSFPCCDAAVETPLQFHAVFGEGNFFYAAGPQTASSVPSIRPPEYSTLSLPSSHVCELIRLLERSQRLWRELISSTSCFQ